MRWDAVGLRVTITVGAGPGPRSRRSPTVLFRCTTGPSSTPPARPPTVTKPARHHVLLMRRNRKTSEYAFYRAGRPHRSRSRPWSRSPGAAGASRSPFASGKELSALDEHQVRSWTSWQRWSALAILAHALLSVLAATEPPSDPATDLIRLTRNEIRHLLTNAFQPVHDVLHVVR